MRNIDRIKELEHELGRCRDKIGRQGIIIQEFKWREAEREAGMAQISTAVDDILARTAIKFGNEVRDEETGELIGYNMELPSGELPVEIEGVRAKRDEEKGVYLIGVVLKVEEEKDDAKA